MAKYGKGPANTVKGAIKQDMDGLDRRLRQVERSRVLTTHISDPRSNDAPVEGEHIIDGIDNKHAWYVDGQWRKAPIYDRAHVWLTYGAVPNNGHLDPGTGNVRILKGTSSWSPPWDQGHTTNPNVIRVNQYGSSGQFRELEPMVGGVYALHFRISLDDISRPITAQRWNPLTVAWDLWDVQPDYWDAYYEVLQVDGFITFRTIITTYQDSSDWVPIGIGMGIYLPDETEGDHGYNPDWIEIGDADFVDLHGDWQQGSYIEMIYLGPAVNTDSWYCSYEPFGIPVPLSGDLGVSDEDYPPTGTNEDAPMWGEEFE